MKRWLAQRRKAVVGLIGALATWSLTEFPDNQEVHLFGGLIVALVTALSVHQVANDDA